MFRNAGLHQTVTLFNMRARPEPLVLRLRPAIPIPANRELNWELQNNELRQRVEAIFNDALRALPEDNPQRATLIAWHVRFRQNPLRTEQQRYRAAVDLEWLLYEQIETQSCLRIAIDDRRVNAIAQVLLNTPEKVLELREKYRARARQLLHQQITAQTIQRYQTFVEALFYEVGLAASNALAQERGAVVQEGRMTEAVCQNASTTIHEACMQTADTVETLREDVVNRYRLFQAAQEAHQASLQTLKRIIEGNTP